MMSHVDDISVDRFEKILEGTSVSFITIKLFYILHFVFAEN